MFRAIDHPTLVPFDGRFDLASRRTDPGDDDPGKKKARKELDERIERLRPLQRTLYASDRRAVLLIFQAMDAAGKDGTIRAVTSGIDPTGFQVFSFKKPSAEELDHDFLWRTACRLPERGRIGIFNRSYYEEVLVVRVHPAILEAQRLPRDVDRENLWEHRYESMRDHEKHLARNGTVILKFFLNVSPEEQRKRFLDRIDEPDKNWKFSSGDVEERAHWDRYMEAYRDALAATSRPWAPWYAIPADDKPYMRMIVADLIADSLESLGLRYPELPAEERAKLGAMRERLQSPG